jgi:alpha-methylacyl-CoA racemase
MEHQHFKARGMIAEVPTVDGSYQEQIASPFKFSRCTVEYRHVGAELGEQTEMLLKNLGYTEQQIEKLKNDGVCADNKTS